MGGDQDLIRNQLRTERFEPFLRHIRFPKFKNLVEHTRIDFSYPITAIVGPNGTNKSSILRALQGCPDYENIGNHWFTTNLDPIDDEARHRFIHGYQVPSGTIVESIKTRISKPNDPDYWEPARPRSTDDMKKMPSWEGTPQIDQPYRVSTRWKAIQKAVVYSDFRYHISAFDLFYTLDGGKVQRDRGEKKNFLRRRTKHLQRALDSESSDYTLHKVNRIKSSTTKLSKEHLTWVNRILGREYREVQIIEHLFYEIPGYTVLLNDSALEYSEAFAGSGEYTAVLMVKSIIDAPQSSLIILDEPEVSLHPHAQRELMRFLTKMAIKKSYQFVLATHSPTIVEDLPPDAIKVMSLTEKSGQAQLTSQATYPSDAFKILGARVETKQIFVEDELARLIIEANLNYINVLLDSRSGPNTVEVVPLGGGDTIITQHLPSIVRQKRSCLVFLDGDQEPFIVNSKGQTKLGEDDQELRGIPELSELRESEVLPTLKSLGLRDKKHLGLSGGTKDNHGEYFDFAKAIIDWSNRYLRFLPCDTPEELLLEVLDKRNEMKPDQSCKEFWVEYADSLFSNVNQGKPSAPDILAGQKVALNGANMEHPFFQEIQRTLRKFVGEK